MTKDEHIAYWVKTSNDDWEAALLLFQNKKYVQALFFGHLTLEKLCKAHWVKDNENNIPPRTHNLVRLVSDTNLNLSEDQLLFLEEYNDFQLEGRYPDYLFEVHKRCNFAFTNELISQVKSIMICLQEKMQ